MSSAASGGCERQGGARRGEPVELSHGVTLVKARIILRALFGTETDDAIIDMKDAVETMKEFERLSGGRILEGY